MSLLDWLIVIVPIILLLWMAIYSGKYARGVVDYLAAGRIAGRYVLGVGDMAAALSVITLIAGTEARYQTGYRRGCRSRTAGGTTDSAGKWKAVLWIAPAGTGSPGCSRILPRAMLHGHSQRKN